MFSRPVPHPDWRKSKTESEMILEEILLKAKKQKMKHDCNQIAALAPHIPIKFLK